MNTNLVKFSSFLRILPKYSSLLLMLVLFPSQQLIADERAKKGKCYISTGYVENKSLVEAAAKKLFINFNDFELFERKDKKIYLTIGKTEKKLFDKLKSDGKTFDFNCTQGKGFQKRYSFDENFKLIEGRKKFIDFQSDYFAVIAPIEAEKKRLVDAEVQRQVEARMEAMRLAEIKKQEQAAAKKERLRLAEIARKKKAEADRLASIEKAKQNEMDRLAAIEKAKQDEILKKKQAALRKKQAAEKKRKAQLATYADGHYQPRDKYNYRDSPGYTHANAKLWEDLCNSTFSWTETFKKHLSGGDSTLSFDARIAVITGGLKNVRFKPYKRRDGGVKCLATIEVSGQGTDNKQVNETLTVSIVHIKVINGKPLADFVSWYETGNVAMP